MKNKQQAEGKYLQNSYPIKDLHSWIYKEHLEFN
jgi:hypothetical protein